MKHFLFKLTFLTAVLAALTIPTFADTAAGTCGDGIEWGLEGSTLVISGNGPMENFEDEAPWAAYKDSITAVTVSGNVTTIGDNAFKDYDNITEVDFGSAMHTLGKHSFQGCDGLTRIHLPGSFRIFDEECLRDCSNLTAIHCEGPFPSFKQNCLWGSNVKIYYPAKSPWSVTLIQQLEEAFSGRIEFLDSDGNDHYTPEETTEPTTEATTAPTTTPTTAPTTAPTTEPTTVPTTEPTTVPTTEAPTEAPMTEETTFPFTFPETTEETQPEKKSGGAGVGLALIGVVLCLTGLGILVFRRPGKKGKYSR